MILARHAEAVFWAGRHLERTEHTTRMLDIVTRDAMHFPAAPVQYPSFRNNSETVTCSGGSGQCSCSAPVLCG